MLKDVLHETWTYQQILNEGHEEWFEKGVEQGFEQGFEQGTEQGIEQGIEQGKDIGVQESITTVIQGRFPELEAYMKEFFTSLNDKMQLRTILLIVATAQTPEEVKRKLAVLVQQQSASQNC